MNKEVSGPRFQVLNPYLERSSGFRMEEPDSQLGVVSFGLYLPSGFESAEEIAERSGLSRDQVVGELGIEKKYSPSSEDLPVVMAVKAARQALERIREIAPEEIDVVIWTGEEYKDYIAQTASIRIQEEVGARNAWAFDLIGQGTTSLIGLRAAQDLMIGDPTVRTVLLAGGTRDIDLVDPSNPETRWMLPTSASGAALLMRRGHPRNRLLGTGFSVDPEMADEVFVPGGGTVRPFHPDILNTRAMFFHVAHPQEVETYLAERLAPKLVGLIKRTLAQAGFPGEVPDYLALRHLLPRQRYQVLEGLGLSVERTDSLADAGHHGPNDVILSLDRGLKKGMIKNGSRVLLAAAGIGFTYAAALIQWGS
jgi:3-oxoacyl-[acyl-carrier-protein] synthase-3